MARLTLSQAKMHAQREKTKLDNIKKKREIQEKKELYGENWKEIERKQIQEQLEEFGGNKTPKVYDSKDLYDFISPIKFYKDENNAPLNLDYENFRKAEIQYKNALKIIDEKIKKIDSEIKSNDESNKEEVIEEEQEFWEPGDGNAPEDDEMPLEEDVEGFLEERKEPINSARINVKTKLNRIISTYFNRFVPLYNKHVCTCCGTPKNIKDYYIVYNLTCGAKVDFRGNYHLWVCKNCVQKLLGYYYSVVTQKNLELSMQYLCATLNLYWDSDLFYTAKKSFEDSDRRGTLVGQYIITINNNAPGLTFIDSPFITEKEYHEPLEQRQVAPYEAPYDWSKEDAINKKTIYKMVGYDPFDHESEEDKKILYRDLLNILDEGMENDFVKLQAGIQIVQSFYKIRKMNSRLAAMEQEEAPLRDQKDMADLKAKELKSITDFSRDNGFSERYATAKARGENTLTGIMRKMDEQKYEKAILNRYDIATSETIQQAANASFKAIFNQLGMGESEVWKVTQTQFEELTKLRKENLDLQENLRLAKYKIAELNLKEKEREKKAQLGIEDDED